MARSVNTKPHLDIQHVNRWQAQIGADLRKKTRKPGNRPDKGPAPGRKEEPLDPEDDFMIATDPADKPIDEATIDDAVEVAAGDWIDSIQSEEPDTMTTAELLDAIYDSDDPGEAFTEVFKRAEEEVKQRGLPRAITRDMLYEIGMRTDVDYEIDSHNRRAVFKDNFLNELLVDAYAVYLESLDDPDFEFTKKDVVEYVSDAYNKANSQSSEYEYLKSMFMHKYDINETYSDMGNPTGDYKLFLQSFNKTFKWMYRNHLGLEGENIDIAAYEDMLSHNLGLDLKYRRESYEETRWKQNRKRRVQRQYAKMYPEVANDTDKTNAEKYTLMDLMYTKEHGQSLFDDDTF